MTSMNANERMLSYYPEVIKQIEEINAITNSEGYEFDELKLQSEDVLNNAYLLTIGEDRIAEWEKLLSIRPLVNSTLQNRRDTIIARIRGQGKLNTDTINSIVKAFTGGYAECEMLLNAITVQITPPPENKNFQIEDVKQELRRRLPAHIDLLVSKKYLNWSQVETKYQTWGNVNSSCRTWGDVLLATTS